MDNFWEDLQSGRFANMVKEESKGQEVSSPEAIFNIIRPLVAAEPDVEQFWTIFLNGKNKILAIEKSFSGTLGQAAVYPREMVKACLHHKAAAVVFAHNHPSGDSTPSSEDRHITKALFFALASIGIAVHDHVVVGNDNMYSMQAAGEMDGMKKVYSDVMGK